MDSLMEDLNSPPAATQHSSQMSMADDTRSPSFFNASAVAGAGNGSGSISASSSSDELSSAAAMDLSQSQHLQHQRQAPASPRHHGSHAPPPGVSPSSSSSSSPRGSVGGHHHPSHSHSLSSSHILPSPSPVSVPSPAPLDLPPMRELPPIKLGRTPKDRALYEQLGDLYSIVVTTEHIEAAYVRDAISEKDYTGTCSKLIAQYKTLLGSMGASAPTSLEDFCREFNLECHAALNRLNVGVPATIIHGDSSAVLRSQGDSGGKMEVAVFHAVQHFITMMDALKLNQRAVDELHPTLTELVDSVNKVPGLANDHESKQKTLQWLTVLHQMKAHEELNDEQCRQMIFDLDSAYNAFHKFVQQGK